jgi:sigma-B regulation protein RsbU (phosphoserine phosphatase)
VILRAGGVANLETLEKTGMALGAIEDTDWDSRVTQLEPGDALILYTDGITDAQNQESQFFGRGRLLQVLRDQAHLLEHSCEGAHRLHQELMNQVRRFMGSTPQYDDMTLMILARNP